MPRCAPTEHDDETGTCLKGSAHDFSARVLGGVCGIAGAFSTVADLAKFLQHLLEPSAGKAFSPAWVQESLQIHTGGLQPARGLFWHPASGTDSLDGLYEHYGFTGTGMWISLKQERWAVLLTNKLYYSRDRHPLTEIRNAFRAGRRRCRRRPAGGTSHRPAPCPRPGSRGPDGWCERRSSP
ncbi:serine hydrolase [Nonomuraea angiospora]|uniref:serine hydrolase n=1 Tax=Nonomuraea angiospora TaxID=46172 RepID=UPI0017894208